MKRPLLPNVRSLDRLRPLLPYAAKLLPILTGVALPGLETAAQPDLTSLDRQFGEMQTESRGLRTQVEDQSEQINQIAHRLEGMSATLERSTRQQEQLTADLHATATRLRGLCYAMLFLLLVLTTITVIVLVHVVRR